MRKILSTLLAMLMLITMMPLSVMAFEENSSETTAAISLSSQETESLISVLNDFEQQKSNLGLNNVNFYNLYIGNPIQTYIYKNNTFTESHKMYPILEDGTLVFWAYKQSGKFQLTTGLTKEVNSLIINKNPFAIVYDVDKAYAYCNGEFFLLAVSPHKDNTRSVLNTNNFDEEINLEVSDFTKLSSITFRSSRAGTTYKLDVDFVSQDLSSLGISTSNICWAASAACIVNYVKGKSLTAVDVAKSHKGSGNFNDFLIFTEFPSVIDNYALYYTVKSSLTSDNTVLGNLQSGYPIASNWTTGTYGHTCVIYGINIISGYYYLMDPAVGFTSAVVGSNGYTFVDSSSGATFTLGEAACYSW